MCSHMINSALMLLLPICNPCACAAAAFGFGGLWRFAGPFSKSQQTNLDNAELFVNCLEAMVETCLPVGDDGEAVYSLASPTGLKAPPVISPSP
ncbi:NF1 [Cordylochernes scorpioides]|uniref:NF1 n=1 Tax=Cordylochernes scorpioides TaxID=51811 RepID=A0ABY6KHQ7_9ARAC|nr:NF1 [Cordylochernes scorpioides]